MKYRLMDLLACPLDKDWPLKLEIIEQEKEIENLSIPKVNPRTGVVCNFYCNFKNFFLIDTDENGNETVKSIEEIKNRVNEKDCKECFQVEIQKGRIFCSKEKTHVYEIKEGIPVMLTSEQLQEIYGNKK